MTQTRTYKIFLAFVLMLFSGASSLFAQNEQKEKISLLFAGDLYFGETYQAKQESKGKPNILKTQGYEYSLMKIAPLLKKANQIIANLETPLTDSSQSPFTEEDKYRIHKGDIKNTPATLKKYNINVVSLANNHTMDYGKGGLYQTIRVLKDNSISFFGAGMNEEEAALPYLYKGKTGNKKFNIIIIGGLDYSKKYDSVYNFYAEKNSPGVNAWKRKRIIEQIKSIRSEDKTAFIIAYPHWFENYVWKTEDETKLAHAMIDTGADMVMGHGTHMLQEIELYKDKWIIYSLGNFVFNAPGRYEKKEANPYSLLAMLEIAENKNNLSMNLRLYPILSDNLKTNYQPRFLVDSEKQEVYNFLKDHSINIKPGKDYEIGKDEIGDFINLGIRPHR